MINQDELRRLTRIARAENFDIFTYDDFASVINIKTSSLYSWLNRQYDLKEQKAQILSGFISDIIE